VARTVAAAVCQGIVLIHSILADTRYDAVSARKVYEITGYVDLGPEMIAALNLCLGIENDFRMRGVIANAYAPDSLDPVADNTEIMKLRRLVALNMDVNAAPALTGNLPINVMDMAIGNMDMAVRPARVPGQNIDTTQCPLIPVGSVGICNLNPVNLPELHIFQEDACRMFSQRIDDRLVALAVGLDTDGSIVRPASTGRKHANKGRSSLKANSVTRLKFSLFVEIEVNLRIDAIHRRVYRGSNNNCQ
jgi:hypothetical protein